MCRIQKHIRTHTHILEQHKLSALPTRVHWLPELSLYPITITTASQSIWKKRKKPKWISLTQSDLEMVRVAVGSSSRHVSVVCQSEREAGL